MWGVANASVNFAIGSGPQASEIRALREVSIEAPKGVIQSIVGGDGAGKTTLLNTLIGRVIPASGTVSAPASRLIGFMPSTSGVWRDLSVDENVTFVGRAYGMSSQVVTKRRDELLERAGLTGTLDRLGGQLSGGMRQKLGFCLALLHEPELIVLDEPSTGVDPVSRIELWRLITEAAAQGVAVVMTSTYLDEAERAEQVLVLDEGVALYSGPPQDIAGFVPGIITQRDAVPGVEPSSEPSSTSASMPGVDASEAERSWRRGRHARTWHPAAEAGSTSTAGTVIPDLEDAVIALTLAHRLGRTLDENAVSDSPGSKEEHPRLKTVAPDAGSRSGGTGRGARTGPSATEATGTAGTSTTGAITAKPIVNLHGVIKRFGAFTALNKATLTVRPGEVVGLLGANGAGKTTLIRILLGLESADYGEVVIFDQRPSRASRRRLGYMPQGLGLYEELSVAHNVDFVVGAFGVRNPIDLPPALRRVANRPVASIGLGLQRQLAFHCALVHEPELLVLDEPTSGVDPLARARLWDTIRGRAETGTGVLVTTHYMQEAEQCDRLILLSHGEVIASGREAEIIGNTQTMVVEGGSWQQTFEVLSSTGLIVTLAGTQVRVVGASKAEVSKALDGAGLDEVSISEVPATLEERLAVSA